MKYEILYQPSYSVAKITLQADESIMAESGAMVSMSSNIEIKSEMGGGKKGLGGFMKAAARGLAGESFFVTRFTAKDNPGEIIVAPGGVGDIQVLELENQEILVQSGSYLAASPELQVDTKFTGGKSFFSKEGFFMVKVSGTGKLFVSSFGAIHEVNLAPDEEYIVDNGHIVAFDAKIPYTLEKAAKGLFASMTSGEGLVCKYKGPGKIYLQTRQLQGLASLLAPFFKK
ncbi:MAG: hypothetical protein APR63_11810 [Desulfuromonas sp. SDB]|nr:MAG: hypothetical protein APR63_11810 [Desulfuromonas sp. SDB]